MVTITKHGEDRLGRFLVEGTIKDMRFVGWQKGQKRRMGFTFFPYDPDLKPVSVFGEEGIDELRKEVKRAWMKVKQPQVFVRVSQGNAWLVVEGGEQSESDRSKQR